MLNIFWCFLISIIVILNYNIEPVIAWKKVAQESTSPVVLVCFSGGEEILRKNVIQGPVADEYKFAHEVKIREGDEEYWLNFSGGLCIIDRGEITLKKDLKISDHLNCYSGSQQVVGFEVYGQESTVDEYVEGRTFLAKAKGNTFNSDSVHRYLVFGAGACLGKEISM